MVNCQKFFFSNANTYLCLVILIEIFILKTTVYHKYTLITKIQKKLKKRYYRLCTKHWRHLCAIPMLLFVICFSS
jgi:hypothetical protein